MQLKKYKVNPNISEEELLDYGFRKIKDGYLLKVSAYKYKKKITLLYLAFLITYRNGKPELIVDCKNNQNKWYIPFYNPKYNQNNIVLDTVNKKLKNVVNNMAKNNILQTSFKHKTQKEISK